MVKAIIYTAIFLFCAVLLVPANAGDPADGGGKSTPEDGGGLQIPETVVIFEDANRKVAVINGEYITYYDIMKRVGLALMMLKKEDPQHYKEKSEQLWNNTIVEMAGKKLFSQAADKEGITVVREDVDELVSKKISEMKGFENFIEAIAQQGMTEADFRKEVETDLKIRKLVLTRLGNIPKDSSASVLKIDVFVPPREIKNYYEANREKFVEKKKIKLRYIVLKFVNDDEKRTAKELGESIIRQVDAGADFATLAKYYSDFKPEEGGERDWVAIDTLFPSVKNVVEKMKPGEHSGLVETDGSFRIFKLEGITEERQKSFAESENSIRIMLSNKRFNDALEDMRDHLLKGAVIQPEDLFERNTGK